MELRTILTKFREENKISQRELARRSGLSNSLISILEMGVNPQTGKKMTPDIDTYKKLADAMGIRIHDLFEMIGDSELVNITMPKSVDPMSSIVPQSVPLIGEVAAGKPITAEESYDVYVDSPVKADYALRVKGDSMNPTYLDGDVVYIRMVESVPEGTVAVVLLDNDACLKHVYYIPNGVQLVSDNPAYPPMICTWPEYDNIRVLGKVVGYTRVYK